MANVTLKIAPEDDPLGTPLETWDDNDILDLKLDISLYDLGRNTVRIPRKTWEASSLKAHTDGTYYVRVDIPYIDGSTTFWGFWLVSGEFVLTDPNERGGEDVTIGGPGPMWYLTKARLNYREYSSHSNVYVEDERWHFDGLTYGGILDALIDEDQASPRQALPDLDTPGWGAVNDADGNPWEDFPGIFSVDMGTDYLSVLRELQKADHLYAWMTPGEFNLRAVKAYGDDHSGAAFGAGVVRFEKGVNIVGQLRRNSEKGPLYTHVLAVGNDKVLDNGHVAEGQPIHVWVVSDDWQEGDAIRQGFLSFDTNSEEVLERRAKRFIRRSKDRSESLVRFQIMPGDDESAGLYLPGRPSSVLGKFWIGDTITIDTGGGNDLDFNERDIAIAKIGVELGPAVREDTDQGSERSWKIFIETGDDVRPSASADSAASTGAQTVRRCRCRRPVPFCTPIPPDAVETEISNSTDDDSDWPGVASTADSCWSSVSHQVVSGAGGSSTQFSVSPGDLVYGRIELRNESGDDPWENVENYSYQAWLEFEGTGQPLIQHEIIHQRYHNVGCINVTHDTVHEVPTGYETARIKLRNRLGGWKYRGWIGTLTTEEGIECPPFSYDDSLPHESPYYVPSDTLEYLLENHTHEVGVIEDSFTNETDDTLVLAPDGAGGVEFRAEAGGGGGSYTDEQAQDAVGGMLADTATVNLTYTDATPELKADVIPGGIDVTDLTGYPGGTTDFLRADGSFAAPSGADIDLTGLTVERRIQGISDYVVGYDASADTVRGFPPGFMGAVNRGFTTYESDCIIAPTGAADVVLGTPGLYNQVSAGNAAAQQASEVGHIGIFRHTTGTSTTGRSGLGSVADVVILTGGKLRFLSLVRLTTLSDGTNRYSFNAGIGNAMGSTSQTDGVTFKYSDNLNSGKWQCTTDAASAESTLDSGVAVAAATWYLLEFEVNAAGTSVEFFINGTSVGTLSTNIPTATMRMIAGNIVKSLGSTARTFDIDAYRFIFEYATMR